ncbi:MAG: magnesium transporter [Actinomycetota bacterium]
MARPQIAVRRRARRLWSTLGAERRTLRQGLVALVVSTFAGFVAGLILAGIDDTLRLLPGLLVLIPAAVGMRGTIFGAIGARLGTSIHAGLFETTMRQGGVLRQNASVALLTTLSSSVYLAALARLASAAFGEPSISFWDLLTISVVGGLLGSMLILAVTIGFSVLSYRRGWDLDAVATPMVTALGDMATLPTLFLATFLVRNEPTRTIAAAACAIVAVVAVVRGYAVADRVVRRVVLEMTAVIVLTPVLDILAGSLLQARSSTFRVYPAVLLLVPPFVGQAGALGGILCSRLSSKLQLGVITPRGLPEGPALIDGGIVLAFGATVFALIGCIGYGLAEALGSPNPGAGDMIGGTILAGMFALPIVLVVGYYVAIVTARFGLDPDNHSVPAITSVMDLVGVICLLSVLSLLGVSNG